MTEDVRFISGNDRISQLAQRPDLAEGVAQVPSLPVEADPVAAIRRRGE